MDANKVKGRGIVKPFFGGVVNFYILLVGEVLGLYCPIVIGLI